MLQVNASDYKNDSFTFFGPMGMAFFDDGTVLEEANSVKIIISLLLGISMVLSIVGNVCTCAVIARDHSMRTPTNCYLLNLAITDLMITIFIPIEIRMIWVPSFYPLGEAGCLFHFLLLDGLSNCSVLTIVAFTVERFIVISKPFLRHKLSLNTRVFKIVALNWIICILFCIPDIFYIDLLEWKEHVFCYYTLPTHLRILMGVEVFVFFIIPMTIIFVLYVLIALKLKSTQLKLRSSPVNCSNKDRAVIMLAAVAASFFFCWSPYFALRIMMIFPKFNFEDYYDAWKILNYICSINGYMSTAVNPILYSLMSRKFRQAFKDLLKGRNSAERMRSSVTNTRNCEVKMNGIELNNI